MGQKAGRSTLGTRSAGAHVISDRGKIRSRRVTHVTRQQQRQIAQAIKNAREMALLPYSSR
ncbi:hypothetical protein SALBM311S_06168 [Streptomyces alboniger]